MDGTTEGHRYWVRDRNNYARLWIVSFKERLDREASVSVVFMWWILFMPIDNGIVNLLEYAAACTISTLEARFKYSV